MCKEEDGGDAEIPASGSTCLWEENCSEIQKYRH